MTNAGTDLRVVDTFPAPHDVCVTVKGPPDQLESPSAVQLARDAAARHIRPGAILYHLVDVHPEHGLVAKIAITEDTPEELASKAIEALLRKDEHAATVALTRAMGHPDNAAVVAYRLKELGDDDLDGILHWVDGWLRSSWNDALRARGDPRWRAAVDFESLVRYEFRLRRQPDNASGAEP